MSTLHRRMSPWRGRGLYLLFACGLTVWAGAGEMPSPQEYAHSTPSRSDVLPRAVLRAYVQTVDEVHVSHYAACARHFCFVQQSASDCPGEVPLVWMVWDGDGRIQSLAHAASPPSLHSEPTPQQEGRMLALAKSPRLATDVVPTWADIAGSCYLLEQAWVDRLMGHYCVFGRKVTLAAAQKPRPASLWQIAPFFAIHTDFNSSSAGKSA